MNESKLRRAILGMFCLLSAAVVPAQAVTLLEIYNQAVSNDHQFRAAAARADAGREAADIARAQILPSLSGEAAWVDNDGTRTAEGASAVSTDSTTTAYSINLQQAVLNFSAWNRYKSGKSAALAADFVFETATQELVVRTADAYFNALSAVDHLDTARAEEAALAHQLEQTRQRFEVGLTAITEVHEAQAAYDSATANRLVAEGQLGIAFEALEVLTGQSYNALAPLREAFPVVPPEPADRTVWEKFALEHNPSLKTAYQNAQTAKADAASAKSEHYPTVTAFVGYEKSEIDGNQFQGLLETRQEAEVEGSQVRVALNVPLFAGGGISASRRQAYASSVAANEIYLQTQRDVIQAVRSSHLAVLTSAATVKARKQAIVSSRSALEATQAGYDVGTRDLVDVLNAQRNLYSAQRDYYSALYTYVLATLQLRQSAGILSGEQVAELNQWLDKDDPVIYTR